MAGTSKCADGSAAAVGQCLADHLLPCQAMQNQAASSSGSQPPGAFGFPGNGAHANQSASDAALNYATMLQMSEQARLIGMAESTLTSSSPPSNEHDLKNKIREVVRMEMKEAGCQKRPHRMRVPRLQKAPTRNCWRKSILPRTRHSLTRTGASMRRSGTKRPKDLIGAL